MTSAVPPDDIRFQTELEFIQCLASPAYLNYLAINRYFEKPAFLNYLKYLGYWKQPEYAKYLVYPQGLAFLDMIQDEKFQNMIKRDDFMTLVHAQQFFQWQYYLNNRLKGAEASIKEESTDSLDAKTTEEQSPVAMDLN